MYILIIAFFFKSYCYMVSVSCQSLDPLDFTASSRPENPSGGFAEKHLAPRAKKANARTLSVFSHVKTVEIRFNPKWVIPAPEADVVSAGRAKGKGRSARRPRIVRQGNPTD